MGMKTSALLLSPGDLIDEEELLEICGVSPSLTPGATTVDEVFCGYDDKIAIADFSLGKALISWDRLPSLCDPVGAGANGPYSPLGEFLETCSVDGAIAYVALGSGTNLYGLVLWQDGALVRAVAGSANDNDGLPWLNIGDKLSFESSLAYTATRRIEHIRETASALDYETALDAYLDAGEETGVDQDYGSIGEELVFELIEQMLGSRPDMALPGQPVFGELPARVFARPTPGAERASKGLH